MISIQQLAEEFENGLNAVLNNPEIQFKIWAEAGEYKKPERNGNVITHQIFGNLITSTSSNDANNILVMGVNGLSLDFKIPVQAPHTNATQTAAVLQKIKGGQYPFIKYITDAINKYFQKAQAKILKDESGDEYSVAFQGSSTVTGSWELAARYANSIEFAVYIQVYFIQGGTSSKNVRISVDGKPMPFLSVRVGRAPAVERDVFGGDNISKCLVSSTALAVEGDFPCSTNPATMTALEYVVEAEPNTAHFINVEWGQLIEKLYFMTYNTVQASAEGISIAGLSVSFMEVVDNQSVYNVPKGFQVGRFEFDSSNTQTLKFTLSEECETFISGVGAQNRNGEVTVALTNRSFEYDDEKGKYYVTLVTDRKVTVSRTSAPFVVIPEV